MAELITGIHAQPAFPGEDLSDTNASMLELMLANAAFVEEAHLGVEKVSWTYKVGHATVVAGSRRIYEPSSVEAINAGVSIFEAMAAFVAGDVSHRSEFAVNSIAADLVYTKNDAALVAYAFRAIEMFREDMPRATDVVLEASRRNYSGLREYALLGAAIERQFSLDVAEAIGA